MKRFLDYISIILFFTLVSMIGISAAVFRGAFENGIQGGLTLESGKTAQTAEKQLTESFPMLRNWRLLYSRSAALIGQRQFGDIYFDNAGGRLIRIFSEYDSDKTEEAIKAVNNFYYLHRAKPCYIMLVPTASGIYRGDLPETSGAIDQQKLIDDLYYAAHEDITPLDVFNPLYSARDGYIYFRTEPYWTQLGAYEAYNAAISKLGAEPFTIANYDIDYTRVYFSGELSRDSGSDAAQPDCIDAFRCKYGSYIKSVRILEDGGVYSKSSVYKSGRLQSDDKYSYFLGSDKYKCAQIETTNEDMPSILIICSDYANCFAPFLAPHYSKITLVDLTELDDDEQLGKFADVSEYDQVLFLYDAESFCEGGGLDKL